MKTSTWLVAACLAASLPAHAQFKPIEIKDQDVFTLGSQRFREAAAGTQGDVTLCGQTSGQHNDGHGFS